MIEVYCYFLSRSAFGLLYNADHFLNAHKGYDARCVQIIKLGRSVTDHTIRDLFFVCRSNLIKDITNQRQRYMPKTCLCYKSEFKDWGAESVSIIKE